jgi:hypothetical protein
LFCSIIGKQAGWILSTSLIPDVASGQSGEVHLCLAPSWARPGCPDFVAQVSVPFGPYLTASSGQSAKSSFYF